MIPQDLRERIERLGREKVVIAPYDPQWDELLFRDYLIAHPDVAQQYADLKQQLAAQFPNDRVAYTDGKGEFIRRVTALARER